MTLTHFCAIAGLIICATAAIIWVLMALARKITRNDDHLHKDDDFSDFFDHR